MVTNFDGIPAELKTQRRWVVARPEVVDGRKTKVPYCAHDPARRASSTDPADWSDFETARALLESGRFPWIGFVFTDSGYFGVDYDNCRNEEGEIASWALDLIFKLSSYTEISQSGKGAHTLGKGNLPGKGKRTGKDGKHPPVPKDSEVEMYDSGRYFVLTGDVLPGYAGIMDRTENIAAVHAELFPEDDARSAIAVVRRWTEAAKRFEDRVGSSEFEKKIDKCLAMVKGREGHVNRRLIARRVKLAAKDMREVEETLKQRGHIDVVVQAHAKGAPPKVFWRWLE